MPYKIPALYKWEHIEVTWHDAASDFQQVNSNAIKARQCIRKTLGHFIKIDGEELIIAGTDDRLDVADHGADCADITYIPIGMVKKITRLFLPAPVTKKKRVVKKAPTE
jgi:hypothetical protein